MHGITINVGPDAKNAVGAILETTALLYRGENRKETIQNLQSALLGINAIDEQDINWLRYSKHIKELATILSIDKDSLVLLYEIQTCLCYIKSYAHEHLEKQWEELIRLKFKENNKSHLNDHVFEDLMSEYSKNNGKLIDRNDGDQTNKNYSTLSKLVMSYPFFIDELESLKRRIGIHYNTKTNQERVRKLMKECGIKVN